MAAPRIMIVEDETIVSWALSIQLESWGYAVSSLESCGSAAIEAFHRDRPDLILMDINLADDIDGIRVAETIHRTACVPIIFITASQDAATLVKLNATNPSCIISKPYSHFLLKKALAEIFTQESPASRARD